MISRLFPSYVTTVRATAEMWSGEAYPEEMAAVARAAEKRRREFVAGRLCARQALAQLGIDRFPLLANPDRTPRWPTGIVGSISHCRDYCGVAVARIDEVLGLGLDVEQGGPLPANIVDMVCADEELDALSARQPPGPHDWPKLIFSAKEAFYKCYYPLKRCFLDFHDVRISFGPDQTFTAHLVRESAPAITGRRGLEGRWTSSPAHVFTGVSLT